MQLTWNKVGVMITALTVLQGLGYFVGQRQPDLAAEMAAMKAEVHSLDHRLELIEGCLLDHRCGR